MGRLDRWGEMAPRRCKDTAAIWRVRGLAKMGHGQMLFTHEGQTVDREAFVTRSQGDPRAWTIIVSPGHNDLDMERYVREFMLQLELDLDVRLD